jgi:UDP-2,3-diacylglucosamine hydrolase
MNARLSQEIKENAVFVSDLHFGAIYPEAVPSREQHFCEFLQVLQGQVSHLFILGDLFEFWMEYAHYIPKDHFEVLAQIRFLAKCGVEIHYLSGNHDFNLGNFFNDKLGIQTHQRPLQINLQGKALYIYHGDGTAKSDRKYRIFKKIMLHPFSNWGFKLLHPDLGMTLAKFVGKKSHERPTNGLIDEYQEKGLSLVKEKNVDIVMHGHTHMAFIKESEYGLYINTGNWITDMRYIEMEDGKCSLKTYVPDMSVG